MDELMGRWIDGWMRMGRWMDGWMDEWPTYAAEDLRGGASLRQHQDDPSVTLLEEIGKTKTERDFLLIYATPFLSLSVPTLSLSRATQPSETLPVSTT